MSETTNTETTNEEDQKDEIVATFIKPKKLVNQRKRKISEEIAPDKEEDDTVVVVTIKEVKKVNTFGTKNARLKDFESSHAFTASRTAKPLGDQNATAINRAEGDDALTAEIIEGEKAELKITKEGDNTEGDAEEEAKKRKEYKGIANYSQYLEKKKPSTIKMGPQKAPLNIRVTSRFDYQPDLCKDYYQTGFCGYGMSCKFLHDRGDYKSGWQLEKEWNDNTFGKEDTENFAEEKKTDDLPFACFICRQSFNNPVVTKCNHYFCESCALKRNSKNKRCAVCGEVTGGIFNVAHALISKLKKT